MPGPARATSSIRVSSAVFAFIYKKAAQASDDGSHLRAHGRRTRALSRTHPAWLFVLCWRGSTEPSWRLDGPSRCPSRLSLRASSVHPWPDDRDLYCLSQRDRKSTRLNSSHGYISYAVFCLKKKNHDCGGNPSDNNVKTLGFRSRKCQIPLAGSVSVCSLVGIEGIGSRAGVISRMNVNGPARRWRRPWARPAGSSPMAPARVQRALHLTAQASTMNTSASISRVSTLSFHNLKNIFKRTNFFFLNNRPPTEFSSLPLPAPSRT